MKPLKSFLTWLRGENRADLVERVSICTIIVAAAMITIGIGVGTFVPGVPVALAIVGSALVIVGIIIYVISEFMRFS